MNTYKHCSNSGKDLARNYARGKSFDFTIWNPQKTYVNDDYKQDFVSYQGKLYACVRTNTNVIPTNDFYWVICVNSFGTEDVSNSLFLIGEGVPSDYSVPDGTVYFDLLNNTFYKFTQTWKVIGKINTGDLDWGEF